MTALGTLAAIAVDLTYLLSVALDALGRGLMGRAL